MATYGRSLVAALKISGSAVSILFGANVSEKGNDLLKEVAFYDYLRGNRPKPGFPRSIHAYVKNFLTSLRRLSAFTIPDLGIVEKSAFLDQIPQNVDLLNIKDLYIIARQHFKRKGEFLKIRLPRHITAMHWTYPMPIIAEGIQNFYTIHDLVPLRLPHAMTTSRTYYYKLISKCIESSTRICTISETSKNDLQKLFPDSIGKIVNTYQATPFEPPTSASYNYNAINFLKSLGLETQGYFIYFGSIEPKKNIGRLIIAYLQSGSKTPLLLVGKLAWQADEELALYNALVGQFDRIGDRIKVIPYLSEHLLKNVIENSKGLLFPSIYEGFGLPVLEAMALGIPTLTSTSGALPEVSGDATVAVSAYDVDSIANGITRLDQDDRLRQDLVARGLERAKLFSMANYSEQLNNLYQH